MGWVTPKPTCLPSLTLGSRRPLASQPGHPKITTAQGGDRHWGYFWQAAEAYNGRATF